MRLSFKPIIEDSRARLVSVRNRDEWVRILPGEQRKKTEAPTRLLSLFPYIKPLYGAGFQMSRCAVVGPPPIG
jgi:hypothetical protein